MPPGGGLTQAALDSADRLGLALGLRGLPRHPSGASEYVGAPAASLAGPSSPPEAAAALGPTLASVLPLQLPFRAGASDPEADDNWAAPLLPPLHGLTLPAREGAGREGGESLWAAGVLDGANAALADAELASDGESAALHAFAATGVQWLQDTLPFVCLLLLVFLQQHIVELLAFFWCTFLLRHANGIVRNHLSVQPASPRALLLVLAELSTQLVALSLIGYRYARCG